jgi:preprotein translocase subunit SecB
MSTKPVCEMQSYNLTHILADWAMPEEGDPPSCAVNIGYDVAQNVEAPDHYRLTFRARLQEKDAVDRDTGYYVEAHIVGYFSFPASVSEDDREYLIRVNGGAILYGILRGHIASLTGLHPAGPLMLPTVMMHDIVMDIEKTLANDAPVKKITSKAKKTAPRAKKRTQAKRVAKKSARKTP